MDQLILTQVEEQVTLTTTVANNINMVTLRVMMNNHFFPSVYCTTAT